MQCHSSILVGNNTHCGGGLALALGASGGHLLGVAVGDVQQHTRTLLTAIGTGPKHQGNITHAGILEQCSRA